eukprot:gene2570-7600_t
MAFTLTSVLSAGGAVVAHTTLLARRLEASIAAAEDISSLLASYETEKARALIEAHAAGMLPARLHGALSRLLGNLQTYKRFLPDSVIAGSRGDSSPPYADAAGPPSAPSRAGGSSSSSTPAARGGRAAAQDDVTAVSDAVLCGWAPSSPTPQPLPHVPPLAGGAAPPSEAGDSTAASSSSCSTQESFGDDPRCDSPPGMYVSADTGPAPRLGLRAQTKGVVAYTMLCRRQQQDGRGSARARRRWARCVERAAGQALGAVLDAVDRSRGTVLRFDAVSVLASFPAAAAAAAARAAADALLIAAAGAA